MLRTAFILLLLANLLFYGWTQGYFGPPRQDGREPHRLEAQLMPEKIRLVGDKPAPAAPAEPAAAPMPVVVPAAAVCRSVAVQPLAEAERLQAAIAKAAPELATTLKPVVEAQSYWVYIPPLATRQAAEKKSAELKKLGIAEYYVVQDEGPNRNAVSLGLFRSEQAAHEFLGVLAKKGVRSATVQVRDKTPDQAALELRGPADKLAGPVAELLAKAKVGVADCAP